MDCSCELEIQSMLKGSKLPLSKANATSQLDKTQLTMAWVVWGLAAFFYFSDYLARVAPGVMHKQLQYAFGLNEAGFGILTASFYVPYIVMQIPVGLMVDRLSIRGTLTTMALITALGCTVFGLAGGVTVSAVGRMLIGFSAAFAFVSALRLATTWFPASMLGLLAGLTQALGMLGAAAGEMPVSFLVGHIGWRHSMLVIAFVFILLACLLYQFIRDNPTRIRQRTYSSGSIKILQSLRIVLSHRQCWINALYAGFLFAPTAVIGEAIGPAYLQYARGLSAGAAAFATGLIFIGWGVSGPLSGWFSDRIGRRKSLMIFSALLGFILMAIVVFYPQINEYTMYVLFFAFGATNTGVAISYAVCAEIFPKKVIGTAIGFTNMASIFIGACMQPLVGKLIDSVSGMRSYHVENLLLNDFQAGLKLLPACSLIALVLACLVKETYCHPVEND